jgi:hypothetical protein
MCEAGRMPEPRLPISIRRSVVERARGCCEYCRSQEQFCPSPFSVEHIVPRSKGGSNARQNLAFSCQGCNNAKYVKTRGRDLTSGEIVPLFHPRRHRWDEHFEWDATYTLILAKTPIGRVTVENLRLNRPFLQNLRRITRAAGYHPPALLPK